MDDNILIRKHGERRVRRAAAGGVDDGGVDSTACGGRGGGDEAAPRGGMVDEVKRERLHEGLRLLTMGGGGGERRVRPRQRGREIIMVGSFLLSSACFCREPAEGIIWREKKSFFPPQVENIPEEVGKNSFFFSIRRQRGANRTKVANCTKQKREREEADDTERNASCR